MCLPVAYYFSKTLIPCLLLLEIQRKAGSFCKWSLQALHHHLFVTRPLSPFAPSSLTPGDFAIFSSFAITALTITPVVQFQDPRPPAQFSNLTTEEIQHAMLQDLHSFITTIINFSISSVIVPTEFKKARVTPILKKRCLVPAAHSKETYSWVTGIGLTPLPPKN